MLAVWIARPSDPLAKLLVPLALNTEEGLRLVGTARESVVQQF